MIDKGQGTIDKPQAEGRDTMIMIDDGLGTIDEGRWTRDERRRTIDEGQ